MIFSLLSSVLMVTATIATPRPTSKPTPRPTPAPTDAFRTTYCEYNITGLTSDDFTLISNTTQEDHFKAEMEDDIYDSITADSSIVATSDGGVGDVTISGMYKNTTTGSIDLHTMSEIYWSLSDELEDNQWGVTGNFEGLMANQVRDYFSDTNESIQFNVYSVYTVSAANSLVAVGYIASLFVWMYL